jgi:hypothetical protein
MLARAMKVAAGEGRFRRRRAAIVCVQVTKCILEGSGLI